jgi:hypothetical protein
MRTPFSGQYLLIFINTGEIYVLDCIKMVLLSSAEEGQFLQGRVTDYASLDMKKDLLLSVSEGGHGRIIRVEKNDNESSGHHYERKFTFIPFKEDFRVMPPSTIVIKTFLSLI